MSAKRSPLPALDASAFASAAHPIGDPVQMATSRKLKPVGDGTRIGKVQIQAWVTKEFRQRLKIHAARMDTTVEQLVTEALERLLPS